MCFLPLAFFTLKCQAQVPQLTEKTRELVYNMAKMLHTSGAFRLEKAETPRTIVVEDVYILSPYKKCGSMTSNEKVAVDYHLFNKIIPTLKNYFGTYVMEYINKNKNSIEAFFKAEKEFATFIESYQEFITIVNDVLDNLFTEQMMAKKVRTTYKDNIVYFDNFGLLNEQLCKDELIQIIAYTNNVVRNFITNVGSRDNHMVFAINGSNKFELH